MASVPAQADVVVIGAGPSGAIASALLRQRGYSVVVLERQHFPRFTIGESLLPHCMEYIEEAGMLEAVQRQGFQFKDGAAFGWGERYAYYDFRDKFTAGPGTTFQVDRGSFDKILADEASAQGVDIHYGCTIVSLNVDDDPVRVGYTDEQGQAGEIRCRFVFDASGFGRVAARLLDLEQPSSFPVRHAVSTHIDDHIDDPAFDRNKILITVHPTERDIWYWLIPFSDGRCSTGVVATPEKIALRAGPEPVDTYRRFLAEAPVFAKLLHRADFRYPSRQLGGYSASVKRLAGERFALLGNAGEFLDPIFSSGITIAMRSASIGVALLDRQLQGETVDWDAEYEQPLRAGVETFRVFVESWYNGLFQDVIFFPNQAASVRQMISAVLAGYAWDTDNPFVAQPQRRMQTLANFCKPGVAG